jgi:hypothetical protein
MNTYNENWKLVAGKLKEYGIENDSLTQELIKIFDSAFENGFEKGITEFAEDKKINENEKENFVLSPTDLNVAYDECERVLKIIFKYHLDVVNIKEIMEAIELSQC